MNTRIRPEGTRKSVIKPNGPFWKLILKFLERKGEIEASANVGGRIQGGLCLANFKQIFAHRVPPMCTFQQFDMNFKPVILFSLTPPSCFVSQGRKKEDLQHVLSL